MKEYLLLLLISIFVAHNVGTTYGELTQTLLGEISVKLERVQIPLR